MSRKVKIFSEDAPSKLEDKINDLGEQRHG